MSKPATTANEECHWVFPALRALRAARGLSTTARAVFAMLMSHADDNRRCFPSRPTLASECECSLRAVANALVPSFGKPVG